MYVEFDSVKDAINIAKHGLSLADARALDVHSVVKDDRFAGEQRYRLYGTFDGAPHCLAAVLRDGFVRAISFVALISRSIVAMSDKPIVFDDDNPEWTEEDFARAKPLSAFPELEAAFKRARGRPVGSLTSNKQRVTIRLDRDALERLRAQGPGWQTRINEAVRKAAGL